MAKLHSVSIKNFRGIKEFHQNFFDKKFVCLIGRGDSGKSTILDAISYVLSPSWTIPFYDTDFHKCNTGVPVEIEATLTDLDEYFLQDNRTGLHIRGIDKEGKIVDDFEESEGDPALTIRLLVQEDLEPRWYIVPHTDAEDLQEIKAAARARLNANLINDYADRHFSWNKGNPLYNILKQQETQKQDNEKENIVVNALREAKQKIDENGFKELKDAIGKVIEKAAEFGVDINNATSTLDFKDIAVKDSKVVLHDEDKIPFRLKGKGLKRLISIAIQLTQTDDKGIILIDEVEHGLEPDRAQHLVSQLKKTNSQVFITTHSRDVAVELEAADIMIMREGEKSLKPVSTELQGCIRKNPEAFFAKKIIVCEGLTEIGFCRAVNSYRITMKKPNAAYSGVRFVDGTGSQLIEYVNNFRDLGYNVALFCDSDVREVNDEKEKLRQKKIEIIDCDAGFSIEEQIFDSLPWAGVKELLQYHIDRTDEQSTKQALEAKHSVGLLDGWIESETPELRKTIGIVSKKNEWFKRIDHGEYIGGVVSRYLVGMDGKKLKVIFNELVKWMDND